MVGIPSASSLEYDVYSCSVTALVSVSCYSWLVFSLNSMLIILSVFIGTPDLLLSAARFTTGYVRLFG